MATIPKELEEVIEGVKQGLVTVTHLVKTAEIFGWIVSSINNNGEHGQTVTLVRDDDDVMNEHGFPMPVWHTV